MKRSRVVAAFFALWSALPSSVARSDSAPARAAPPPPESTPPFVPYRVRSFRLSNGIQVYAYPEQDERVAVTVAFDTSDLTRERRALHLLTGALTNSGTAHLSTTDYRERKLSADATIEAASYMDDLRVAAVCPAPRLNATLELLHAVILDAGLTVSSVSYARDGRAQWLGALLASDPTRQAMFRHEVLLWGPTSPYGLEFSDTADDVKTVKLEDVEKTLTLLRDPKRTAIAIAGKYDDASLDRLVEGAFGSMVAPPPARGPRPAADAGAARGKRQVVLIDRSSAVTARIRVGASSPPLSETDDLALLVLSQIMGSSGFGRLDTRLHGQLHLTDKVGVERFTGRQGDYFLLTAEVPTAAAAQAVHEIELLATALVDQDVGADELRGAKERLVAEHAGSFESVKDVAGGMLTLHDNGVDPDARYQSYAAKLAAIGPDDVRRVAGRFLTPSGWKVVVLGDASVLRPELTRVGYAPDTR